jgi:aspartate aminotransferase-like enzyme
VIKHYLLAPGPAPVPPRVLLTTAQPIIHHRTPQFGAISEQGWTRVEKSRERRCYLRDKMQVTFGGGQDRRKSRGVRIGHLGYIGTMETIAAVGALGMVLRRFSHPVTLGKGVAAAQEVLMDSLPQ